MNNAEPVGPGLTPVLHHIVRNFFPSVQPRTTPKREPKIRTEDVILSASEHFGADGLPHRGFSIEVVCKWDENVGLFGMDAPAEGVVCETVPGAFREGETIALTDQEQIEATTRAMKQLLGETSDEDVE